MFANGHVLSEIDRADPTMTYLQSTQIFRNQGGGRFADISAQAGPDVRRKIVGRGIAIGDFNADGRLDLLIVDDEGAPLLLRNDDRSGNHWLALRCVRPPGPSDAVGARVTVTAAGRKQVAEVRAGGSYLSTNAPEVHFGLGAAAQADNVEICWPDGRTRRFAAVTADHLYRVTPTDRKPRLLR